MREQLLEHPEHGLLTLNRKNVRKLRPFGGSGERRAHRHEQSAPLHPHIATGCPDRLHRRPSLPLGHLTQALVYGLEHSSGFHILENADFDIVLTDLVMPGMDGSELLHRIKERDPDQEVVVVTGVVDVKTAVDAMKLGATDYLLKPFDRRTLTVTLDGILQSKRLKVEHARFLGRMHWLGFSTGVIDSRRRGLQ